MRTLRPRRLCRWLGAGEADKVSVAEGLLPEPFLLALTEAGVPVGEWPSRRLGVGRPNATHRFVAGLAEAGARVWTVNFDRLIEGAAPGLRAVAWPGIPMADTQLAKPCGTLGGELIVTARQVLQPLSLATSMQNSG